MQYPFDSFDYLLFVGIRLFRQRRKCLNDHRLDIQNTRQPTRTTKQNADSRLALVIWKALEPLPYEFPDSAITIEQLAVRLRHPKLWLPSDPLTFCAGRATNMLCFKRGLYRLKSDIAPWVRIRSQGLLQDREAFFQ